MQKKIEVIFLLPLFLNVQMFFAISLMSIPCPNVLKRHVYEQRLLI